MKFLRKKKPSLPKKSIDTLIVVGNGFDCWQGLDTSYASFHRYYQAHREMLMRQLHIPGWVIRENGRSHRIGPVEILYGDPLNPGGWMPHFGTALKPHCRTLTANG